MGNIYPEWDSNTESVTYTVFLDQIRAAPLLNPAEFDVFPETGALALKAKNAN